MVATVSVKLNKVKLDNLIRALPGKAVDAVESIALEGEAYVKQSFGSGVSSPGDPPGVDTGALRASIHVEKRSKFARAIVTGVDYDAHLEFGTTRMGARPYMGPMAVWLKKKAAKMLDRIV